MNTTAHLPLWQWSATSLAKAIREKRLSSQDVIQAHLNRTSRILDLWAYHNKVTMEFSRPGKPTDNGHIESFNGSLRDECLNTHWFLSLADAKDKIAVWLKDYNESRPHRALNNLTPFEYVAQLENGA